MYKKILCGFQVNLLQHARKEYEMLALRVQTSWDHDLEESVIKHRYLLHEMCAKISADAVKFNTIRKKRVLLEVETTQEIIRLCDTHILTKKEEERTFHAIFKASPSFKTVSELALENLQNKKFIFQAIMPSNNPEKNVRKKLIFFTNDGKGDKLKQLHESLTPFLTNSTYQLNYTYQITFSIETTILSLLENGIEQWDMALSFSIEEAAECLLTIGKLYYGAACRIAYEHERQKANYDPMHYGKLIVVMHSIYAMLDILARKDSVIGLVFKDYKINTYLNDQLSFKVLWKNLMLPNKTWVSVLGRLKFYFEAQQTKTLFYHGKMDSTCAMRFALDADQKDDNIILAIALLKQYPAVFSQFEKDFELTALEKMSEKWAALFFKNYLPPLFCCLRDMAYYAQISLQGITSKQKYIVSTFNKNNANYIFPDIKWFAGEPNYCWHTSPWNILSIVNYDSANHPTRYKFQKEQEKFRNMLYSTPVVKTTNEPLPSLENQYIVDYPKKPESLMRSQYLTFSFIRTHLHIKLSRLYLALKNNTFSLEVEEHFYLIKQTLFEISEITWDDLIKLPSSFLEKRFKETRFAEIFVGVFTHIATQLQQKLYQHQALGNMLDILHYLHSFCPEDTKKVIETQVDDLRFALMAAIKQEETHKTAASLEKINIWHAYVILTYQTKSELSAEDVENILKARLSIEKNARLHFFIASDLYEKMMQVCFYKQAIVEEVLQKNPTLLNTSPGNWILQATTHLYQNGEYLCDPMWGRLYKNNVRIGGLPKNIYENSDFQAAFGKASFLVKREEIRLEDLGNQNQILLQYSAEPQLNQPFHRRITYLNFLENILWLEEKCGDKNYQTFVPHRYLDTVLPKVLIEKYTHWLDNETVLIKNAQRETEFTMNIIDGTVFSIKHQKYIIPFHHAILHELENLKFWKILSNFEDSHYILLLTAANTLKGISDITKLILPITDIYFPRLNLSFKVEGDKLISNDFKGYHLATCQQVNTLLGLSHYLVIESQSVRVQRKIIIGHRHTSSEHDDFHSTKFQLNLKELTASPAYFTYTIDLLLETIHAETLSGKLYLAWLFYKTASLARDPLTKMNGYEITAETLKTCWQNYSYDALELSILLRFLDMDHVRFNAWKEQRLKNEKPNEIEIDAHVEEFFVLRKDQHRNAIAILLRVLFLLSESLYTHFLHKKESMIQLSQVSDSERKYYLTTYGERYFLYYLSVKNRIHEKCLLSLEEESKFLKTLQEVSQIERLSEKINLYLISLEKILMKQRENYIPVKGDKSDNYKKLLQAFTEKHILRRMNFVTDVQRYFPEKYKNVGLSIKTLPLLTRFSDYVDFSVDFDISHFIALYQLIYSQSMPKEKLISLLNVIALKKRLWWEGDDIRSQSVSAQKAKRYRMLIGNIENQSNHLDTFYLLCLRILYLITCDPDRFQTLPIPLFLLKENGNLRTDQIFSFSNASRQLLKNDFFNIVGHTDEIKSVREDLWESFQQHFLQNYAVKNTIADINAPSFIYAINHLLSEDFARKHPASPLIEVAKITIQISLESLQKVCLSRAQNQALLDFFIQIAEICDRVKETLGETLTSVNHVNLGIIQSIPFSTFQRTSLLDELIPEDKLPEFKLFPHRPLIDFTLYFSQMNQTPEQDSFPLQFNLNTEHSPFGVHFIQALQASYDAYLSTSTPHYQLLNRDIHPLRECINVAIRESRQTANALWSTIDIALKNTPTRLQHGPTSNGVKFSLLRHSGQYSFYSKNDILSALLAPQSFQNKHPFIANIKNWVIQLQQYIQSEIQYMHFVRVMEIISQYETLQDEEEKIACIQEMAAQLFHQAQYPQEEQQRSLCLLFELENNLVIRDEQHQLLKEMLAGVNAYAMSQVGKLFQFNMGKGKTSVILILLVHYLTNGHQLVRLNILEPLMGIMKDLFHTKLGGLLRKNIYHMPFSRDVDISLKNLEKIYLTLKECQENRHLIVTTPEHRLCLQLKYQETLLQYLEFKEADNKFDWKKYQQLRNDFEVSLLSGRDSYSHPSQTRTFSIDTMKDILVKAGYIDKDDIILKCPEPKMTDFLSSIDGVIQKFRFNWSLGIYDAYSILRTRAISLRDEIKHQLDLLAAIKNIAVCDILDESDEILRDGRELNYTLDAPQPLDGEALRWKIPYYLFDILFCDPDLREIFSIQKGEGTIDFIQDWKSSSGLGGGMPYLRLIDKLFFETTLKSLLASKLMHKIADELGIKDTTFFDTPGTDHPSYLAFVLASEEQQEEDVENVAILKQLALDNQLFSGLQPMVLLGKAWLSHNLLYHVMSRRYCVQYGLDAKSGEAPHNEMAIPYKDMNVPAPRSEFSHPDVTLGLTLLSYYYQGLHAKQVTQALLTLKTHPQSELKLQKLFNWCEQWDKEWIAQESANSTCDFPIWPPSFSTLDIENSRHIEKITRCLARNPLLIDYFLSALVFPNKAKYYERKITGNAHTLAGESNSTGFSGTNDREDTMPATVEARVLSQHLNTNGKMLHIINREINQTYYSIPKNNTEVFLKEVIKYINHQKNCYALIDAGAMAAGMSNISVAKKLLKNIRESFKGVVFFDDDSGQLLVMLKEKDHVISIATCHLKMQELFVYFDDAHTRGSDLKLPFYAQGIVTLCREMNKDKFMQAVMRLRQLEVKQSISLWGPEEEVSGHIKRVTGVEISNIRSQDVLMWLVYNTIQKVSSDLYRVTMKKFEYVLDKNALLLQEKYLHVPIATLIARCAKPSPDELVTLYGKTAGEVFDLDSQLTAYAATLLQKFTNNLNRESRVLPLTQQAKDEIRDNKKLKLANLAISLAVREKLPLFMRISPTLEADQEKEKEVEKEQVMEVVELEKRSGYKEEIWDYNTVFNADFVESSSMSNPGRHLTQPKLLPISEALLAAHRLVAEAKQIRWHPSIMVTQNFIQTINIDEHKKEQDNYLRPVDTFLLHKKSRETFFILLSGAEANEIRLLFDTYSSEKDIFLMHLSDTDNDMLVPYGKALAKEDIDLLKQVRTLLKLFNGECQFSVEERVHLDTALAIISPTTFMTNEITSERSQDIYNRLSQQKYIQQRGFFSASLITTLAGVEKQEWREMLGKDKDIVRQKLKILQEKSMVKQRVDNFPVLSTLPNFFKKVVTIRDNTKKYHGSILEEKLGPM